MNTVNETSFSLSPESLIRLAHESAARAYAPYSNFRVGAALLCSDGSIVTGVNVENRSFGLTNCAERTAVFTALAQGKTRFLALAVSCIDADYPVSPCGACRQVVSEFTEATFPIYFAGKDDAFITTSAGELFPHDALHELNKKTRC